jgi:hypothetical protein
VTSTQLALVNPPATDPHADARRHVWLAIETAAALHDGWVSPNVVRAMLAAVPEWDIPRGVTGAVYRDLRRQGVLVPVGTERSDDVKGGNAGRLIETFRLVTA